MKLLIKYNVKIFLICILMIIAALLGYSNQVQAAQDGDYTYTVLKWQSTN